VSFFDRVARRYDRTFAPDAASTRDDLRALTAGVRGVALDLGCGTGRAFPHLLEAGLSVIGLDGSRPMLVEASRRSSTSRVAVIRADLWRRWPIADGSVDLILALHSVLAHPNGDPYASWAHVGREIARVARPGARVAIDIPDPAFAERSMRSLGDDRFVYADEIEAVIPAPARVLAALALPLSLTHGPLGPRALGTLKSRS